MPVAPAASALRLAPALADALRGAGTPVIVTGATGWLGLAALEMLDGALSAAMPGSVLAFASQAREITLRSGRRVWLRPYDALATIETQPALILHFAFLTRGHAGRADYVAVNRRISELMQDFIARAGARGVFVPSSGAVYRADGGLDDDITSNPYGVLKHEDEVIFAAMGQRLGFPCAIMRIFNLAGPFINNLAHYALACIIADVRRGGPVVLRASHPVWRSYAHVGDVLSIGLAILLQGLSPGVFDSAGETPLEIGALAGLVSQCLLGRPVPIHRPDWQAGVADRYLGDFTAYQRAAKLAGVTLRLINQQIIDTAEYLAGLAG